MNKKDRQKVFNYVQEILMEVEKERIDAMGDWSTGNKKEEIAYVKECKQKTAIAETRLGIFLEML